jgi:succinylglutamate desuccinylase
MLTILNNISDKFFDISIERLYEIFSGPSLIKIQGKRKRPLFLSILLHGNEDTGLLAIQALLKKYQKKTLPRSLIIFIGNIKAARYHKRRLDHQLDYNRIWQHGITREHAMAKQVLEIVKNCSPIACIDIHNNTGMNPHYAAVNSLDQQTLNLASLFNRTVIYFTTPEGTITAAFSKFCPSIIMECGQTKQSYHTEYVVNFIENCLYMSRISDKTVHKIDLFQPKAIVKTPTHIDFGFGNDDNTIRFVDNIEHYNFRELNPGFVFATIKSNSSVYLEALDNNGNDVKNHYFFIENNKIKLKTKVMPSMLTHDCEAIRKDCLCYLMERMSN